MALPLSFRWVAFVCLIRMSEENLSAHMCTCFDYY